MANVVINQTSYPLNVDRTSRQMVYHPLKGSKVVHGKDEFENAIQQGWAAAPHPGQHPHDADEDRKIYLESAAKSEPKSRFKAKE